MLLFSILQLQLQTDNICVRNEKRSNPATKTFMNCEAEKKLVKI